ncbi:MAG: hypothetical protein JXQ66_07055 [Campylobacterales bacterium]|nr:hypothetical protein [Campylobacterales bacterium]
MFGIFFSGCGTAIVLSEYQPSPIQKSKYIPSKEEIKNSELPKIIIMDIDDNAFKIANSASLGKTLSTTINQELSLAKSVKIVKRLNDANNNSTLAEEIKAAELALEVGSDVGEADYVISGDISNTTYDYKFNEGYYYTVETKEGKKRVYNPPSIDYSSCVSGTVKVLVLPELVEVKSISFDGCSSNSHEARSPRDARRSDDSLVREAGAYAIQRAINPLKNFFAKKGYIYEMRSDEDEIIVKTNLGREYGAREGEKVEIFAIEDSYNLLEDEMKKDEVKIGNGVISNQIGSDFSWVIVDELYDAKIIKAGDYIKIRYKRGYYW